MGNDSDFHSQLIASTDRFQDLAKCDNLVMLKSMIAQEITSLKQAVARKQKKDQESYRQLEAQVESLRSNLNEKEEDTQIDPLTRIASRSSFDRALQRWLEFSKEGGAIVLALLDIDNLKTINEYHGHQVGDRILQCSAMWLSNNIRATDFVARYRSQEFAVLLAGIRLTDAQTRFGALLKRIAASTYEYAKEGAMWGVRSTLSCGLAQFAAGDTAESLTRRAEVALCDAKRLGKNRVVIERKAADAA